MLAFVVIGLAGVAMNLLIAKYYDPAALGLFNTVLALFIVSGQLGAFGVQSSVQYHTPLAHRRGESTAALLAWAMLTTASMSLVLAGALFVSRHALAAIFDSASLAQAVLLALPGIWLFPINKVLLGYLNGRTRLRAYAIGNASRYVLIVGVIGACAVAGLESPWLAVSLSISECVLVIGLTIACVTPTDLHEIAGGRSWVRRHLSFGSRAMPAGIVT